MDTILISMLPLLVPFAFLLFGAFRRVKCPDCGETLPLFYSPFKKTRRMWRAGGYLCTRCGCETNTAGQKVTADMPPAPFPALQCALLAVFLLIGVGLAASLIVVGERAGAAAVAAPPVVADPPAVIALPAQGPAAAPVN
jgi:DNA-directed RNA polymerase subunit RPC12/RpoP